MTALSGVRIGGGVIVGAATGGTGLMTTEVSGGGRLMGGAEEVGVLSVMEEEEVGELLNPAPPMTTPVNVLSEDNVLSPA